MSRGPNGDVFVPRPPGTPMHRCVGRDCTVCERVAEQRADERGRP